MVGVAYSGGIQLQDIEVDFQVEPVDSPGGIGFGVREYVTLKGPVAEPERVRLQRAVQYCLVGQALTKGAVEVQDEVRWSSGEEASASPVPESLDPLEGALPAMPAGSVHGRYLLDTKEYDEAGVMAHEGEAKVYVTCENGGRTSRWTLLGGHSSPGWVPPPFPLSHSAWAASTAASLGELLPQAGCDPTGLSVELASAEPGQRGGRGESQANAAQGVVRRRKMLRRITLPGSRRDTSLETVQAALRRDPISITYQTGGILLQEEVNVKE